MRKVKNCGTNRVPTHLWGTGKAVVKCQSNGTKAKNSNKSLHLQKKGNKNTEEKGEKKKKEKKNRSKIQFKNEKKIIEKNGEKEQILLFYRDVTSFH